MGELRQGKPDSVPDDMYERFLGCDGENMVMMLDPLHTRYGSAALKAWNSRPFASIRV